MDNIVVSEIQIIPIKPQNGLIAFASCVVNGAIYLGNIAIYTSLSSPGNYRLVYPTKTLPNGKQINCVHPITKICGEKLQTAIVGKYEEVTEKVGVDKNDTFRKG